MKPHRPVGDVVVLILAWSVGSLIFLCGLTVILIGLFHPSINIAQAARTIGDLINTIVGALIGYLAGSRGRGDTEGRDQNPPDPPTSGQ